MNTKRFLQKTLAAAGLMLACAFAANVQAEEPRTMYVVKGKVLLFQSAAADIDSIVVYKPAQITDGVLINGVRWATCNVDAAGSFAATPESAGMFYQWNRAVAWAATGTVSDWNTSVPNGTVWEKANDPSPAGWRVPTAAEIQTLLNDTKVEKVWDADKQGYTFTDRTTGKSIFLPAVGYREADGTLYSTGTSCNYWSSTQYDRDNAYRLNIAGLGYNIRVAGRSVRSVCSVADGVVMLKFMRGGDVMFQSAVSEIDSIVFEKPEFDGLLINGIKWATRNVDAPGTFAATPESYGKFYQWNRKVAWSSTNPMVNNTGGTTWNTSIPSGIEWTKANDPSPAGWRVPTDEECEKLFDTEKVTHEWITQNGVKGRKFTDKASGNSVFFPAAGNRETNGTLRIGNDQGSYWSSTQSNSESAHYFYFGNQYLGKGVLLRDFALSVRPVAE